MMTGPVSVAPDCRSRRRSGHHDHRSTRSSRTGLGDHVQSERVVMSGRNPHQPVLPGWGNRAGDFLGNN